LGLADAVARAPRGQQPELPPAPSIRHHRSRTLTRRDVRRHRGLRVTSPARTLIEIVPRLTRRQFARAVNDARLAGHLKGPDVNRLANLTPITSHPTRSTFEDEFPAFAREYGLPAPQINAKVAGYEVDVLFAAERVIAELDSWEHHQDRRSFETDRERDAATLAAGHVTVRITWERNRGQPDAEAARLHGDPARAARRRGVGPRPGSDRVRAGDVPDGPLTDFFPGSESVLTERCSTATSKRTAQQTNQEMKSKK
jgi:hypothetical protein